MTDGFHDQDRPSKVKGMVWVLAALLLGGMFAWGLAPLARAIPWHWEQKLAHVLEQNAAKTCKANPQADALLQKLVARLYPAMPGDDRFTIAVQVTPDKAVNAFAGLGGVIHVNQGLLDQAQSPEELAGVLAHEIGHVSNRHIMQAALTRLLSAGGWAVVFSGNPTSAAQWADFFLRMNFSRGQEAQADHDGLLRLQKAHIDNNGFRQFFERMDNTGAASAFISDHPSDQSRADMVKAFANDKPQPIMDRADWLILKKYCR